MYNTLLFVVSKVVVKKSYQHIDLFAVLDYHLGKGYPIHISSKNEKANFRHQSKIFKVENGILIHKKNSTKVVISPNKRNKIIQMIHDGSDNSSESSALSSHRGRDATQRMLQKRFYWPCMTVDVRKYIKECAVCQKVNPSSLKFVPELKSINVPNKVYFSVHSIIFLSLYI